MVEDVRQAEVIRLVRRGGKDGMQKYFPPFVFTSPRVLM